MEHNSQEFLEYVADRLWNEGRHVRLREHYSYGKFTFLKPYYAIIEKTGGFFGRMLPWNYRVLACQKPDGLNEGSSMHMLYRAEDTQLKEMLEAETRVFDGIDLTPVEDAKKLLIPFIGD